MILVGVQPETVLLDTCAIVFVFNGEKITSAALDTVNHAASLLVSPVSAWEVGVLGHRRTPTAPAFLPDPASWFRTVMASPGILAAPFDSEIALSACTLVDLAHRDPADRFLIATALRLAVPIMTRDRLILDYARRGHIDAIPC